jgi:predicted O-linked N-acetylglucosamine transferase (SPINDLY family)
VLAQTLMQSGRHAEAVQVYEQAPSVEVFGHDSLLNWGIALVHCQRADEAVSLLLRAIALKMDSVPAYVRLGAAFRQLKMFEEANECFRTAVALEPTHLTAHGYLVHLDQFACRWERFDEDVAAFVEALSRTEVELSDGQECTPFALVAIPHDPQVMLHASKLEARRQSRGVKPLPARRWTRGEGERIRIGYLSADFFQHATAMLIAEVLERHDRSRFELFLYSHGKDDGSAMRARLSRAGEHWIDCTTMSAEAIARRVREDGIDILVDLKGYTQDHRFRTMAYRAAPLQVSWLGFPGTTGAPFIDYFIGDPVVTPLAHADRFSEKLAQMPLCYQPNDRQRPRPQAATRAQWGLPEGRTVLACFNNVYKITPETFASWMRILAATPDAVLWLLDGNEQAKTNLRREAQAAGIDPARLLFSPAVPPHIHVSRLPLADLMLDTWPCNAHTTASDALWSGLPLVTLEGEQFAARVAASLLGAVGLSELVADDVAGYERLVLGLLRDPQRLAAMRARLVAERDRLPLFDAERFARDLDALYERMAERARAGLAPDHLAARDDTA